MKLLLSKGVDIESESDAGTPLVWAAGHGQEGAVKLLLQHNAKVLISLVLLCHLINFIANLVTSIRSPKLAVLPILSFHLTMYLHNHFFNDHNPFSLI